MKLASIALLVRGRPIDMYNHDGKIFVEGRKGTEYSIQLHNESSARRLFVVSVDGLNIVTGDTTWEQGYVLQPWQTLTVPGWSKSSSRTAHFEFSSKKQSYNQHNRDGHADSVGVIGLKIYAEKRKAVTANTVIQHHYHWDAWYPQRIYYYQPSYGWQQPLGGWGGNTGGAGYAGGPVGSMGPSAAATFSAQGASGGGGNHETKSIADRPRSARGNERVLRSWTKGFVQADLADDEGPLGTGWGRDTEFHTTTVSFDRETSPDETRVIYYDTREGLKYRGIDLYHDRMDHIQRDPNPFPGSSYCPNPVYR